MGLCKISLRSPGVQGISLCMLLRGNVVCCSVLRLGLFLLFAFYFLVTFLHCSLWSLDLLIIKKMFRDILCRNQGIQEYLGLLQNLVGFLSWAMAWRSLSMFLLYFCLFIFLITVPSLLLSRVIFQENGRLQQCCRFPHFYILPIRLFTWSQ